MVNVFFVGFSCLLATIDNTLSLGDILSHEKSPVLVDNKSVEGAFAKKMATKWQTQSLIRKLILWAARTSTYFYVRYINTKDNFLADPLSRLDLPRFWCNASTAKLSMHSEPSLFSLWLWDDCDRF